LPPPPLPAPIPRIARANSGILLAGLHSPGATGAPAETRILSGIISTNIRERYPGDLVIVKPDVKKLTLIALRKKHGDPKWKTCWEKYDIPREIMLTGYRTPKGIVLPPLVRVSSPNAKGGQEAADGSGGDNTLTQEEDDMDE
jgi:hypothetical protein